MNNVDIDRINELYHKSKSVGLTKAEEAEQKKLRKAYPVSYTHLLGDFSDKKIVLNCYKCKMIIEGEGLLIEYFTDVDMKITGHIHSIHF